MQNINQRSGPTVSHCSRSKCALIFAMLFAVNSCTPTPDWYPPPTQRNFNPNSEPRAVGNIISMDAPEVETYIISGLLNGEAGSHWRWANQRAELRFSILDPAHVNFFADFAIADSTFAVTGPVTMSFFIDGKPFGSQRYDKPGEKHFEVAVDPALLTTQRDIVVAAEADKFYTSPTDGVKLGFLLVRMGFK